MIGGTWLAWADGLKPLHGLTLGETTVTAYVGLIALAANALVAVFVNLLVPARRMVTGPDANYQR